MFESAKENGELGPRSSVNEVSEDAPDKGCNYVRPLIIFKTGVLINPNNQFSVMHFLGVFFVCMQSFRLLGFMVLELWRRHTDTH